MKHFQLEIQSRQIVGNQAGKLRRVGILPAVMYGKGKPSKTVQVDKKSFIAAYKQVGHTNVVDLCLENEIIPAIIHDIDIHPVTGEPRHVDFLIVNLKEKVKATVPIKYVGTAKGVKELGAVLTANYNELEIEALPDDIPDFIEVDVSELAEIHDSISVADLPKNEKYEILQDPEEILVSLVEGASGIEENIAPVLDLSSIEGAEPAKTEENKDSKKQ